MAKYLAYSKKSGMYACIKENAFYLSPNRNEAHEFTSTRRSDNAIKNILNRSDKYRQDDWVTIVAAENIASVEIQPNNGTPIKNAKDLSTKLKTISTYLKSIEDSKTSLLSELSSVDKEVTDLQHYIEFTTLDACKGFKIYKKLQDTLQRRREIKKLLMQVEMATQLNASSDNFCKTAGKLKTVDTQKYQPRVLTELFENGIN